MNGLYRNVIIKLAIKTKGGILTWCCHTCDLFHSVVWQTTVFYVWAFNPASPCIPQTTEPPGDPQPPAPVEEPPEKRDDEPDADDDDEKDDEDLEDIEEDAAFEDEDYDYDDEDYDDEEDDEEDIRKFNEIKEKRRKKEEDEKDDDEDMPEYDEYTKSLIQSEYIVRYKSMVAVLWQRRIRTRCWSNTTLQGTICMAGFSEFSALQW